MAIRVPICDPMEYKDLTQLTFGERLRYLRDGSGLNQAQLAVKLGVSQQWVDKRERDVLKKLPSVAIIEKMAGVFGCDPSLIAFGDSRVGKLSKPAIDVAVMFDALQDHEKTIIVDLMAKLNKS